MPFPKEWNEKPKVCVYPMMIAGAIVCYFCQISRPKDSINPCTGMCSDCVLRIQLSPPSHPPKRTKSDYRQQQLQCLKCSEPIIFNNIGICRNICGTCAAVPTPLQRCLRCDTYSMNCWNHVCNACRSTWDLCEKVGQLYPNRRIHFFQCWCLTHEQQLLRNRVKERSTSTETY